MVLWTVWVAFWLIGSVSHGSALVRLLGGLECTHDVREGLMCIISVSGSSALRGVACITVWRQLAGQWPCLFGRPMPPIATWDGGRLQPRLRPDTQLLCATLLRSSRGRPPRPAGTRPEPDEHRAAGEHSSRLWAPCVALAARLRSWAGILCAAQYCRHAAWCCMSAHDHSTCCAGFGYVFLRCRPRVPHSRATTACWCCCSRTWFAPCLRRRATPPCPASPASAR